MEHMAQTENCRNIGANNAIYAVYTKDKLTDCQERWKIKDTDFKAQLESVIVKLNK